MQVGDYLRLFDKQADWGIVCQITSIDKYSSFKDVLLARGILCMLPQLEEISKTNSPAALLNHALKLYDSFPGASKVQQKGTVAIGVRFISRSFALDK